MALPETLQTPRFSLHRLQANDLDDLFRHLSMPDVVEHMDIAALDNRAAAQEIIDWTESIYRDGSGIRWAIRTNDTHEFVGTCGFNQLLFERASRGEIAYDLTPAWWGRGAMQEVLAVVLSTGFETLSLHRIEAFVNLENHRSCRTLERLGFQQEGILRDYAFWLGRYWDQRIFALLKSDWLANT